MKNKILIYPRIDCKIDKRFKLCEDKKERIKKLSEKGKSIQQIADKFGVHQATIRRVVFPEYAKKANQYAKKNIQNRYRKDSKFRKKMADTSSKCIKKRYVSDKKFRDWSNQSNKIWRDQHNPLKVKEIVQSK